MPQTAKAQFMKRATEALEQGNTKFVARGENKELFEEMKRKFEQEKNDEPAKRVKLQAMAAAPQAESNSSDYSSEPDSKRVNLPAAAPQAESDYSSDSDSEDNKSSSSHEEESIESETEPGSDEDLEELKDDAHFVAAIVKWFDCKKKHKKVLIQGIKNAFSAFAPIIYKFQTTPLGDEFSATNWPDLDKFFEKYKVSEFAAEFKISLDEYNPTLCKVSWIWTKPAEARQQVKQTNHYDHEAAMAWQAEMQRKEEAWRAYMKTPEANRVHCMAGEEPQIHVPSGYYAKYGGGDGYYP